MNDRKGSGNYTPVSVGTPLSIPPLRPARRCIVNMSLYDRDTMIEVFATIAAAVESEGDAERAGRLRQLSEVIKSGELV